MLKTGGWGDDSKVGNTVLNTLAWRKERVIYRRVGEECAGEKGDRGGHQSLIPGRELCWEREVNRRQ